MSEHPGFTPLGEFERRKRRLPHWESPDEAYFITFRLRDRSVVDLTSPPIAAIIIEALRFFHDRRYTLWDHTIMPDHVHLIIKPLVKRGLTMRLGHILQGLKGWTARQINSHLGRRGPLWQDERHDHIVRNQKDYVEKAAYILDNPRRAGLVKDSTEWPWWSVGVE